MSLCTRTELRNLITMLLSAHTVGKLSRSILCRGTCRPLLRLQTASPFSDDPNLLYNSSLSRAQKRIEIRPYAAVRQRCAWSRISRVPLFIPSSGIMTTTFAHFLKRTRGEGPKAENNNYKRIWYQVTTCDFKWVCCQQVLQINEIFRRVNTNKTTNCFKNTANFHFHFAQ